MPQEKRSIDNKNTDKDQGTEKVLQETGKRKQDVKLAETAGFCFGVKKAVKTVDEQIEINAGGRIYTYGPIIHNKDVIKSFEEKGVFTINSLDEIEQDEKDNVKPVLIIRAHGVPEDVIREGKKRNITVIDGTCPFVKKIHNIVSERSLEGHTIVVAGDKGHPEITGICGWIKGDYYVAGTVQEAADLPYFGNKPVTVVFQTTFDTEIYKDFVEIIVKKGYDINIMNTVCNATNERQNEAALIAKSVDVMLVVGDRQSANTNRLYSICKTYCKDTYYIQNTDDLETINLRSGISVGITAGASTPEIIIQEVFLKCQKKKVLTN